MKVLFERSEPRHFLNMLYIDDFVIWVQNLKDQDILDLRKSIIGVLAKNTVNKKSMGFDLDEYEKEAELDLEEQSE